jgi:hypothetical protein
MAFEFTERMKAIARGDDPDAIATPTDPAETPAVPAVETVADGLAEDKVGVTKSDISDDGEAGTEALSTAGDKEVAPESDSTEVAAEKPVESATVTPAVESWRDADIKSLAKSYGFTDDELNEFGSKAEFNRATRLIDRQLVARRQVAESQAVEKTTAPAVEKPVSLVERMKAKGFDEDSIEIARQLEENNKQLQDIATRSQLAESQREFNYFHGIVDGMSEKLFGRATDSAGRPVQLSEAANENRRKLYEAADMIAEGINARAQKLGVNPSMPPMHEIVRQAGAMVFAKEILAEERAAFVKQVAAQSKNRRPVAGSRPTASGGTLQKPTSDDSIESIVAQVKSKWRERTAA